MYSKERLYELIWQEGYYGADHTISVHISNLRKKIKQYDPDEGYIQSVYGIGFRLEKSWRFLEGCLRTFWRANQYTKTVIIIRVEIWQVKEAFQWKRMQ